MGEGETRKTVGVATVHVRGLPRVVTLLREVRRVADTLENLGFTEEAGRLERACWDLQYGDE